LAAADVNEFLMDQAVQSFAGTAARGSAIATPVTGMTTYLEDIKDLRIYDGSEYRSPFGLTMLLNETFTSAAGVSVNNVFSSEYQNYRVMLDVSNFSSNPEVQYRLRASGVDLGSGSTDYHFSNVLNITSATFSRNAGTGIASLMPSSGAPSFSGSFDIYNPFATAITRTLGNGIQPNGASTLHGGGYNQTTSADGISISVSTGTFTGNFRIYGYRD